MKYLTLLLLALSLNARADPLQDFERIVDRCRAAFESRPSVEVAYAELAKSWVKRVWAPTEVTYDVKKTDSLVSPIVAYIQISEIVATERAGSEDEAKRLDVFLDGIRMYKVRRINFAFQSNAWRLVSGESISEHRRDNNSPKQGKTRITLSKEDLEESRGLITACLKTG